MAGKAKKAAAPKKKANGYKMPEPIPVGEVINDAIEKKKWRIGPSIGVGGFGEIYSACNHEGSPKKGSNYPFVIKIEPHENGPLFVEKHFYIRNANKDDIAKFVKTKKLSSFGMPSYYGNGSHEYKGEKYRYLVLERYGKDLWSLFKEKGRTFPTVTVFQLGLQMLDVLEYIHGRGYVHADIKGANILLGLKKGTENQAYLVDFGLATRVNDKEFKPDPKCAHNGTIEYTSRDAHLGVATMRGDLEILAYNMLQWIVGELPWENSLKQPKTVQAMKEAFMNNVRTSIKQYTGVPEALIKFMEYINTLKPKDPPDYTKCRQFFEAYLKSQGVSRSDKLNFSPTEKAKTKAKIDPESDEYDQSDDEPIQKKRTKQNGDAPKPKRGRKPKVAPEKDNCENEESDQSIEDTKKIKTKAKIQPKSDESDQSDDEPIQKKRTKQNGDAPKPKRGRKPKVAPEIDNCENEEPEQSIEEDKAPTRPKRKSSEPAVLAKAKKVKLAPKATPPVKKNHVNIATQTSDKKKVSPRQVSFDSPICEIMNTGNKKHKNESVNSSGDIFDDSFTIEGKKVKSKRRLLSDKEEIVTRVVRKITTRVKKGKSWKESAAVLNGRSPPK